jgi:hypothetical protein
MIHPAPRRRRRRASRALLALLLAAHLAVSLFLVVPGYLSIDEGTYHYMAENLAEGRPFEVWNGYRELPSPELVSASLVAVDGRLVALPPELFTLVAWPFYAALGYRGLFLLNALAFVALAALTARIARRLAGRAAVLPSLLLLSLATFAWDYSQAAWPHALSATLVAAAFAAALEAFAGAGGRRLAFAALAGLLGGLAIGVRLDSVLVAPALVLPLLFRRPPDLRALGSLAAGAALPLAALAAINRFKFGTWSPFSYGPVGSGGDVATYLPPAAAGLALLAAVWLASRPAVWRRLRGRLPAAAAAAAALALLAIALLPVLREAVVAALFGAWQLVVDLRARPLDVVEPALARTPSGALVYFGALKKSLLQSCPWMAALVLPLVDAALGRRRRAVLLLSLVPAAYLGFYSAFAWHGGLSLNLRYWLPALPFLAVLGALAWRRLAAAAGPAGGRVAAAAGLAVVLVYALTLRPAAARSVEAAEAVHLSLPLALAAAALLLAVAWRALGERASRLLPAAAAAAFAAGAVWAALATFTYDWPRHTALRAANLRVSQAVAGVVEPDSMFFARYPDPYFGLIDVPRLRLAVPGRDRFADFRRLADFHLAAGRPVYASLPQELWQRLAADGLLEGLAARPLLPDGLVVELVPAAAAAPPEPPQR